MIIVREETMPSTIPGIKKHIFTEYQISQIEKLSDFIVVFRYPDGVNGILLVGDHYLRIADILHTLINEGRCYIDSECYKNGYTEYNVLDVQNYILKEIIEVCSTPEETENEIENLFSDPTIFKERIDEYLANKGGG